MKTIHLSKGETATVDDEDYDILSKFKWCLILCSGRKYAVHSVFSAGKRRNVYMHRAILWSPKGLVIDHKDGNGLNNTRNNLRATTQRQNLLNGKHEVGISGIRGVFPEKRSKKNPWIARISINDKTFHIGNYPTKELAQTARLEYEKQNNIERFAL